MKTEPSEWSWDDQNKEGTTFWDGVRNYQAQKHMRSMRLNDLAFFYHTSTQRRVVGVVRIVKEAYPDPSDSAGKMIMVDVATECPVPNPVSLSDIKKEDSLQHLALVKQSRLSVMPIDPSSWNNICQMGGVTL